MWPRGTRSRELELVARPGLKPERRSVGVISFYEVRALQRQIARPDLKPDDRLVLAALLIRVRRNSWPELIVRPETVLGWRRAIVHRRWACAVNLSQSSRKQVPNKNSGGRLNYLPFRSARSCLDSSPTGPI